MKISLGLLVLIGLTSIALAEEPAAAPPSPVPCKLDDEVCAMLARSSPPKPGGNGLGSRGGTGGLGSGVGTGGAGLNNITKGFDLRIERSAIPGNVGR
ncbi:exported protein of unknown function [Bradyrhizobium sp. ORS 285]|uniref:hypothetical protein n=1 Tax=Bradyrhizobium sp. ORS 285 TaxID=115808 RepID=UPI00024099FF|nr:hypothetical protein [Bradyrhizobium sp. ORS 285]CCD85170.1 exported hypothetical protein [Bradyrhizobium sp. ORS 285]SMX58190.1 exported protein of unknown function [Bradyrhizobium sp. ORS 285]